MIALMNLLNRLSESVKFVHEMGHSAEMIMEGQISSPSSPSRLWEMIRTFIVKKPRYTLLSISTPLSLSLSVSFLNLIRNLAKEIVLSDFVYVTCR